MFLSPTLEKLYISRKSPHAIRGGEAAEHEANPELLPVRRRHLNQVSNPLTQKQNL
jgi:hypothetical protein